jgi:ATP-dependent helicase HrpB
MQNLPIQEHLPLIVTSLLRERRLVLQAPPGTGKSTRVPPALLASVDARSEILVAEPRRIAARLLANRVASELGQQVGELVGYRVRFEDVSSPNTRLFYVTSGVLLRRLLTDPNLHGVGCVIIDEFHERHLDTDLALALCLRAQKLARPDLMIVVMSATLEGERLQRVMGGCPFIQSEQPLRPLSIEYAEKADDRPLSKQVASAVKSLCTESPNGDLLVFLPGATEIRRAQEALKTYASHVEFNVFSLHGDMPLREQATVLQPSRSRKVVLCTNVAESSITVPGVVGVIDSGLCHSATCSPWSGLPNIELQKVSKASAVQRAGRAGRVTDGRVVRLYTKGDFQSRKDFDTPEILRMDLCEALLMGHGLGIEDFSSLDLVDSPPTVQLKAAEDLLRRLGALSANGGLTPLGRQMLQFPVHPRLAKLIIETNRRGIGAEGCLTAALLSERDLRLDARASLSGRARNADVRTGDNDVVELLEAFELAESLNFRPDRCKLQGIDAASARSVADVNRSLSRCLTRMEGSRSGSVASNTGENELCLALLSAYPDRVAYRREPGRNDLVMTNGAMADLSEQSVVRDARYLVAMVADERTVGGRKGGPLIRLACRIDPNWLLDLCSDTISIEEQDTWVASRNRIENLSTIRYGAILIDESRAVARATPKTAAILANVAQEQGILSDERITRLVVRCALLIESGLLDENVRLTEETLKNGLAQMCVDRVDLENVDATALAVHVMATLPPATASKLRLLAPEQCVLPGGRSVSVHYESGRAPWIESRLQDFFGMTETPRICDGRKALTIHLLAPNQRAVQVTQDLNGFWDRHYPSIRRELMRRYPKHFWPEDGRNSAPVRFNRR